MTFFFLGNLFQGYFEDLKVNLFFNFFSGNLFQGRFTLLIFFTV